MKYAARGDLLWEESNTAVSVVGAALLALDGSRCFNLLEECRLRYGSLAREQAAQSWHRWRSTGIVPPGEIGSILVGLLPRHLSAPEKLQLIQALRRQMLDRLPRDDFSVTIAQSSDLTVVAHQIIRLMRRVRETRLPADFLYIQDWLTRSDMGGLDVIAQETERFIAAERLSELLLHLAALWQVRGQVCLRSAVRVQVITEVPTARLAICFAPSFQHDKMGTDNGLLERLQITIRQDEQNTSGVNFVERVLRSLTPSEQRSLHTLAAEEGLHLDVLLHEMRGKMRLLRQDIELTMTAASRLESPRRHAQTVSEFDTPAGSTRIEIGSVGFLFRH